MDEINKHVQEILKAQQSVPKLPEPITMLPNSDALLIGLQNYQQMFSAFATALKVSGAATSIMAWNAGHTLKVTLDAISNMGANLRAFDSYHVEAFRIIRELQAAKENSLPSYLRQFDFSPIEEQLGELSDVEVEISDDDIDEFETIFQRDDFEGLTGEQKIKHIVSEIKSQKDPVTLKRMLIIFIRWFLPTIVSFAMNDGYNKAKDYVFDSPPEMIEKIDETEKNRIVSLDRLAVHRSPKPKSKIIGYLDEREVVRFQVKRGRWVKVSSLELGMDGWVKSRHLKAEKD